ncbi:N-acetylglucosamine kinase [Lunatibacter salilacus]|uniref:N-acetylglucosamine kinase n=1 Tax=Lunatibacter salilacus TaxID=2483804 RepID=UPI00131BEA26|nr:N-acetylglucosamine kinase [Lunatibacter salilacus]
MILIADSGSSKTDWRVIREDGKVEQFRTVGFNPYYQKEEDMLTNLRTAEMLALKGSIKEVYFYGAGCTAEKNKASVRRVINAIIGDATVEVDYDLIAAAKATCGHKSGIACILGTGSNSGDYDGSKITTSRPSPGYLLGDEGGGAYIGRHFLQDFIYDDMPAEIRELAIKELGLATLDIQENVYQKPFPNRYMASFCKFIGEHKDHPYCFNLFYQGFVDFFKRHVMRYENYKEKPVNFVGSIAYYNSDVLRKVGNDLQVSIQIILEAPIAGLTLYHQEKI